MGRKLPKFSSPADNQQHYDALDNAVQPKKQLRIKKQEPSSKVILEKIAREFKVYDDCRFEFRASEIEEI